MDEYLKSLTDEELKQLKTKLGEEIEKRIRQAKKEGYERVLEAIKTLPRSVIQDDEFRYDNTFFTWEDIRDGIEELLRYL